MTIAQPSGDDYTKYRDNTKRRLPTDDQTDTTFSRSYSEPDDPKQKRFRVLECSCFGGRYLSSTYRSLGAPPEGEAFAAHWKGDEKKSGWLTSVFQIADALAQLVFPTDEARAEPTSRKSLANTFAGLVVVSGSTGSGKSRIVRSMVQRRLEGLIGEHPERRPHLVTFEDPIESFMFDNPDGQQVDYTPREHLRDVARLDDAISEALRQTPSIFYVGEVRDAEDWRKLLHFAGTGHVVITTAHAGSLTEALGQILQAMEVKTPADRSVVASRLLGVVHLRRFSSSVGDATIPALWRGTALSRMSLVSDGLSSVLPHSSADNETGVFGRAWFSKKFGLQELLQDSLKADLEGS